MEKNPNIEKIVYSHQIKAFLQDSVPLINASTVWPIQLSGINITGNDETVCIIDTGINFTHPDLLGKNKTCIIDCYNKNCVENCSLSDNNGHGTHVAGIVAASGGINGVGQNISLIGVKVLNSNGDGHPTSGGLDLTNAIDWCISNRNIYNISVISMSLGTTDYLNNTYCDYDFSATWTKAINNATFYNISIIAATGNAGSTTSISSPACIQNVTAVGATDKNDAITSYSNRNNITDLVAPGSSINSTMINSPAGDILLSCGTGKSYCVLSGTSMATPHVAGAFALIRQFFRLQNGRVPTPDEIKTTLNNTGKRIDDSAGSGYNFTRIDVWSALISIDSSNPTVSLISPANATTQFTQNITFRCFANDVLLSNITLYVWNSSGIYNNTDVKAVSGVNGQTEFNLTNISYGNYNWNCLAYDHKNNFSFASSNYSLTIGQTSVVLNSPANNLFTNQNQTYNCSAETESTKSLKNITFYLWNSTSLIYNLTTNVSGTINSSIFQYNFTGEENYKWNCLAYNNLSESALADANYTVTYDISSPNLTLISPDNSASYTSNSQQVTFSYNVSDTNLANCSLIIDNAISLTNSSINQSQTQSFAQTFSPGTYNWQINCTDKAENQANSSQRSFTITAPPATITPSGGGGAAIVSAKTYEPTIEEVASAAGYTQALSKNDEIKFTFFDEKATQHSLGVDYIGENFVNLTIQSSVIKLILGVGQSAKLNLTSSDYYNLYIKLNSIENNKAKITIQTIHEEIPKPKITGETVKDEEKMKTEEEIEAEKEAEKEKLKEEFIDKIKNVLIVTLVIGVLVLLAERITKKENRKR